MDSVRELAIVFSAVAVLTGAIGILSGGALEKSAGYILSLIFLASVVSALANGNFNIELKTEQAVAENRENEERLSEYQAEYICAEILEEKGIAFEKITAYANKTEDGSIIISEIRIKGAGDANEAVRAVEESGLCKKITLE